MSIVVDESTTTTVTESKIDSETAFEIKENIASKLFALDDSLKLVFQLGDGKRHQILKMYKCNRNTDEYEFTFCIRRPTGNECFITIADETFADQMSTYLFVVEIKECIYILDIKSRMDGLWTRLFRTLPYFPMEKRPIIAEPLDTLNRPNSDGVIITQDEVKADSTGVQKEKRDNVEEIDDSDDEENLVKFKYFLTIDSDKPVKRYTYNG